MSESIVNNSEHHNPMGSQISWILSRTMLQVFDDIKPGNSDPWLPAELQAKTQLLEQLDIALAKEPGPDEDLKNLRQKGELSSAISDVRMLMPLVKKIQRIMRMLAQQNPELLVKLEQFFENAEELDKAELFKLVSEDAKLVELGSFLEEFESLLESRSASFVLWNKLMYDPTFENLPVDQQIEDLVASQNEYELDPERYLEKAKAAVPESVKSINAVKEQGYNATPVSSVDMKKCITKEFKEQVNTLNDTLAAEQPESPGASSENQKSASRLTPFSMEPQPPGSKKSDA